MKKYFLPVSFILIFFSFHSVSSQEGQLQKMSEPIDKVRALKDTLNEIILRTDNELFANHCKWFIDVIEAQTVLTTYDISVLSATYDTFCLNNGTGDCRKFSTYLNRQRPLIIAWDSPTDGKKSLAALMLPTDWNPEDAYPLYIHLHGLSSTTNLPIDFLCRYFLRAGNTSFAYEDGYQLLPWGRGNLWYQGISETDIWECKEMTEQLLKVDPARIYLTGHSMGGYGAWYIASRSPETFAALGVEAGALWYGNQNLLRDEVIQQLKTLPTYFVTGTQDGLLSVNQQAYNLLNAAGNQNTSFVTFEGGHEHLDSNDELLYLWMKEYVNYNSSNNTGPLTRYAGELICYPNPFKETAKLCFSLDKSDHVNLSVYSSEGKLIVILLNKTLMSGDHEIRISSATLKAGVYFCRLDIGGREFQNTFLVLQ